MSRLVRTLGQHRLDGPGHDAVAGADPAGVHRGDDAGSRIRQ